MRIEIENKTAAIECAGCNQVAFQSIDMKDLFFFCMYHRLNTTSNEIDKYSFIFFLYVGCYNYDPKG